MRAIIRSEFHYTPEVFEKMSITQIAEAYNDIVFVRQMEAEQSKKQKRK
jgi:hypothetical protein